MNRILLAAVAAVSFAGIASAQQAPAFPSDHNSNYLSGPSQGRPFDNLSRGDGANLPVDRTVTGSIQSERPADRNEPVVVIHR